MTLPARNQNASQPPEPTPGQEPTPGATGQGYVTKAELDAFKEEFGNNIKDLFSKSYRETQSQTDRYQSKVQQALTEFQRSIDVLAASGVNLDKGQLEQAKSKLMLETMAGIEAQPPAQEGLVEGETPEIAAIQEVVSTSALEIAQVLGVNPDDFDDEEMAMLKQEGSIQEYMSSFRTAAQHLRDRQAKGTPPAQIPGLTGGGAPASNSLQGIKDTSVLWKMAMEQDNRKSR